MREESKEIARYDSYISYLAICELHDVIMHFN